MWTSVVCREKNYPSPVDLNDVFRSTPLLYLQHERYESKNVNGDFFVEDENFFCRVAFNLIRRGTFSFVSIVTNELQRPWLTRKFPSATGNCGGKHTHAVDFAVWSPRFFIAWPQKKARFQMFEDGVIALRFCLIPPNNWKKNKPRHIHRLTIRHPEQC